MIISGQIRLILRIGVLYFLLPNISHCWNSVSLNISDDVLIWRFAVWRNRAFVAIPRCRPSLIEVPWSEMNANSPLSLANTAIMPFPKKRPLRCIYDTLVSVTGLDTDNRGRLWILDAPDEYNYWPRVLVYDLKRNDRLVSSVELIDVSPKHLKSLVIDPSENQWGFCGYIADAGDETIVVYNLGQNKWWKLRMLHGSEIPRVQSTDLAISRGDSILYMTGDNTHDLFSVNLEKVKIGDMLSTTPSYGIQNVTVTWLGKKLGSSIGLFCDLKDGLHYFMTTERASVRWDTKLPLNAQSYSVLIQNDDVPCITDYIMDAQKSVWGLVNSGCRMKKNVLDKSTLKFRTVRVLKYSSVL